MILDGITTQVGDEAVDVLLALQLQMGLYCMLGKVQIKLEEIMSRHYWKTKTKERLILQHIEDARLKATEEERYNCNLFDLFDNS